MKTKRTFSTRLAQRLEASTGVVATALLAAALVWPSTALAQESAGGEAAPTAVRGGFHFSVGLGSGSVALTCQGCETNFFEDRLNGVSGVLQLGGFVSPQLAITAEFMGWVNNDDPVYRRVASLGVSLLGYPSLESGFFVKGSLGGIRAVGENDLVLVQTDAWMATTGIGYDIPVGQTTAVTVFANYVRSFGAGTWVNGYASDVAATPNLLQFGAGLTVH